MQMRLLSFTDSMDFDDFADTQVPHLSGDKKVICEDPMRKWMPDIEY